MLRRLRRRIPFEAAWFAMADPATLLFTDAVRFEMPPELTPRFVEDEFLREDVNKWVELANAGTSNSLHVAAGGDLHTSYRYREILEPAGFGDELRAALVVSGICWGFICLHRGRGDSVFTVQEAQALTREAPGMAIALRESLLAEAVEAGGDEVGVITLAPDLTLLGMSPQAERWLAELSDEMWPSTHELPPFVLAVAGRLVSASGSAHARLRTAAGTWLKVSATRLSGNAVPAQVAVVLAPARPIEVADVLMSAYSLTQRERGVTSLLLRGYTTKEGAAELGIAALTFQQHLKSIFEKTGVHSRGELAAELLAGHYQPRMREGRRVGPSGWFASI